MDPVHTLVTSLAVFPRLVRKSRVSLSVMSATVPSLPPPYKQDVHRIDTIREGLGRLDTNASIASHRVRRLCDKLYVDARDIAKYLLRTDQIERCHAWINQHRDFCRLLRCGPLLAAHVAGLLLCNGPLCKSSD